MTDLIDSGVCHQAMFLDPSGNTLGLHHRYGEQPQLDPFGAARTGSGLLPFAHCASGFEAVRRLQMAMEDDHELTVAVHLAALAVVASDLR